MILLSGVVGSTAYGLAREGSDVDRLGVFVAPTLEVAGLDWNPGRESKVSTNPDVTLHEVGKYVRLALRCNPTITELLWLPPDCLEHVDGFLGRALIRRRQAFLSTGAVRAAYGGYARAQARRLATRGDRSSAADTRTRTAKHARHLLRLLRQGRQLLTTATLRVTVDDPHDYWALDDMTPAQMLQVYEREDELFGRVESVLPEQPDRDLVRRYLSRVRAHYLWDTQ